MVTKKFSNNDYGKKIGAKSSKGHCFKCGTEVGRTGMETHLIKERKKFGSDEKCTILEITGRTAKGQWMFIEALADSMLSDLDTFMRVAWMECCGHESRFVEGTDDPLNMSEMKKSSVISEFPDNFVMTYIYDLDAAPSAAEIRVVCSSSREKCKGVIRVLARNDPIRPLCELCGADADFVLRKAAEDEDGFIAWSGAEDDDGFVVWGDADEETVAALCRKCSGKHGNEDNYAPFANSPRMGLCGYTGALDVYGYVPGAAMPVQAKAKKNCIAWLREKD